MIAMTEEAATALAVSELRYRRLFESAQDGILILDAESGLVMDVNPFLIAMLGYSHAQFVGKALWELGFLNDALASKARFRELQQQAYVRYDNLPLETADGRRIDVEFVSNVYQEESARVIQCNIRDITARVRAERAHAGMDAQLRHAEKMEAVGRLAGGIAHDFSNLLTGIMGCAEQCREHIGPHHPIRGWLDEITHNAQRSAEIARQLLAFAHKQDLAPRVLDLNSAVGDMLTLLRRLVGEGIALDWKPGEDPALVKIAPSQISRILANLCLNARDAIAGAGTITMATSVVTLGKEEALRHADASAGRYVVLMIGDNGCGMAAETMAHLFEPFYTTKDARTGGGLGLATVYGMVKQCGGFIDTHSAPGAGATFRIHLPCVAMAPAETASTPSTDPPRGGGETILLVEDEQSVRVTCGLILGALGYKTLVAETPAEALSVAVRHPGDIHLLLTDLVMPGMDGLQLANRLCSVKSGLKVLMMSGCAPDELARRGVAEGAPPFLAKPFTRRELAKKVHDVLQES